jgi:acyl-CoA synthetase (NDP forming)
MRTEAAQAARAPDAATARPRHPGAQSAPREEISELARALFRPRAVALIGVGNEPTRPDGLALHLVRRHLFRGAVYPISGGRRVIQGARAWVDLASVPRPVDLALIQCEGDAAIAAVEECGRARIPVAVVQDAFAETGASEESRAARTARLLATARRYGVRVLGPESAGVVIPGANLALTDEAAFFPRPLRGGGIMLLSHGGAALGALYARAGTRGMGFAGLIGLGAELDLTLGEIGGAAADRSDIEAFLLLIGEIKHSASLARFAAKAHATGKPIIAYRLRGAARDAGAAADEFLRAHGILRVDQLDTLFELAPMVVRRRPARGRAVGLVSLTRGAGALVGDRLARVGVAVDGLDQLARERLEQKGVKLCKGPIIDVPPATDADGIRATLDEALDAPNTDAVLAVLGAGGDQDPKAAVAPIVVAAQRADKPLAALVMSEATETTRLLTAAGIAAFRVAESAADGIRAFLDWTPPSAPGFFWDDEPVSLGRARVLHAGQAIQIFRLLGITIPTMLWLRRDTEVPRSLPFPPPYVLKVLSPDIEHRAGVGGLAVGLETLTAVHLNAETMLRQVRAARPEAYLDGLAIQRLERGLVEVSIGFRRDPEAGPIVTLAMGGGLASLYVDRAIRLAPIDRSSAYSMIDEVRGLAPFRAHGAKPRADCDALAAAIVAMSSFALIAAPRVLAAAIDPLLVKGEGQGAVALDGWMRTE